MKLLRQNFPAWQTTVRINRLASILFHYQCTESNKCETFTEVPSSKGTKMTLKLLLIQISNVNPWQVCRQITLDFLLVCGDSSSESLHGLLAFLAGAGFAAVLAAGFLAPKVLGPSFFFGAAFFFTSWSESPERKSVIFLEVVLAAGFLTGALFAGAFLSGGGGGGLAGETVSSEEVSN